MATGSEGVGARAKELLARLSPLQKVALGAVSLTVVAGGLVLTRAGDTTGGASMTALYTDLDPTDAAAVVDELTSRGVTFELTDAGHTVLVPQEQVYDLRVGLAGDGLPASNEGYALLDDQGITTSEFRQRIDYQRALEGELSMTLQAMSGIKSSAVHLALPEESVFVDEPANPTASVLLVGESTGGITDDEVAAVVHLVASSVKNMRPEDVTVIDANGTVLSAPGATIGAGSVGSTRVKVIADFEQRISASLTALLAKTTGPNKVAVTVSADLDLDERQSTSEDYGPIEDDDDATVDDNPVAAEKTSSEVFESEPGDDAGATGVLGPDGAPIEPEEPEADDQGYGREDAERTYAVDRVVEQTTNAPGEIRRLHVAVLLDDTAVTAEQVEALEAVVATAAGIDPSRGDSVVITRLPFDTSAATEAAALAEADEAAAAADAAKAKKAETMTMIRTLAVVVVVIIALLLAYRSARRARRVTATPIYIGEIGNGPRPPEPAAVGAAPSSVDDAAIALDRPEPAMRELAQIADRRPEDVANVLRTWLAESKAGRR